MPRRRRAPDPFDDPVPTPAFRAQSDADGLRIPEPTPDMTFAQRRRLQLQRSALVELVSRQSEALRLYKPLERQEAFHRSTAPIRLLVGGPRSGKTTPAAIEVARAVTNQDPHGKYPSTGVVVSVSPSLSHLGKTIYPRLFGKKGGFRIIRDGLTGLWRAYRPWDVLDRQRAKESRPSKPLIPQRYYTKDDISWYSKKDNQPRLVKLFTGWEIYFYSSESLPPGGFPANLVWFDEEILQADLWAEEMESRLVDEEGQLIWSAAPQHATQEFFDMHVQAQEEAGKPGAEVEEFSIILDENLYIADSSKDRFKSRMRRRGEEVYGVRVEGRFLVESHRMFPEWQDHLKVDRFPIPKDWCVYAVVDPGRQVCAVLFVAIPPPTHELGEHVFFFDELYIRDADARKFAAGMADKLRDRVCQAFIIDDTEGRKHDAGTGTPLRQRYSRMLKKHGVRSVETGYDFLAAPRRPESNREALRLWMTEDEGGTVRLRVFRDLVNLHREMQNYVRKVVKRLATDEPMKRNDHLCDCASYAAGMELAYRRPRQAPATDRGVQRLLRESRRREALCRRGRNQSAGNYVNLGPGQ